MAPKRLLDVNTFGIVLSEDFEDKYDKKVPYAIVSHRWTKFERKFRHFQDPFSDTTAEISERLLDPTSIDYDEHPGYAKIAKACQLARDDDIPYVWLDTCCINKFPRDEDPEPDENETAQAISSMFRWYEEAVVCYAFLHDVSKDEHLYRPGSSKEIKKSSAAYRCRIGAFGKSEWFERGWTLQELLAPRRLEFYDHYWKPLGTKKSKWSSISEVTGIQGEYIRQKKPLSEACIAVKMSWGASRDTGRKEDMAYCMLGIFGVSMEVRYGAAEEENAFMRLQETLVQTFPDESIFAWLIDNEGVDTQHYGLLAPWISCFRRSGNLTIEPSKGEPVKRHGHGFESVRRGIDFDLPMDYPDHGNGIERNDRRSRVMTKYFLGLNCWLEGSDCASSVTIALARDSRSDHWRRVNTQRLEFGDHLKKSMMRYFGINRTRTQYIPNYLATLGEHRIAEQIAAFKIQPAESLLEVVEEQREFHVRGPHIFRRAQFSQYATVHRSISDLKLFRMLISRMTIRPAEKQETQISETVRT